MSIKKNSIQKMLEIIYFLALFSWMFNRVNFISSITVYTIYIYIIMLLIMLAIQIKTYTIKEFLFMIILGIIFIVSWRVSKNYNILILYLFIIASKNIDIKKLIDKDWKIKLILCVIIVILYYAGLTDNYFMFRTDGTIRSSMGFDHPNTFGSYVFSIYCEYIYTNKEKMKVLHLSIISLIVFYVISNLCDSRSSYLSVILLYAIIVFKKIDIIKILKIVIIKKILTYSCIILAFFSFFLSVNYSNTNDFYSKFDKISSGRIKLANSFLHTYSINTFGNKLDIVTTQKAHVTTQTVFVLDNAYINMLLQYGTITFLVFIICYTKLTKKALEDNDYILVFILLIYAIRGITENILFRLYGNIFLLMFSDIIFKYNEINNSKKEGFVK